MRHIDEISCLSTDQDTSKLFRSDFDEHSHLLSQTADMCLIDNSGGRVATCGYWDQAVRVHSIESHREVASCMGHVGAVTGLQLDRTGQVMVSCGADGTCRLWVIERMAIVPSFHEDVLSCSNEVLNPSEINMTCVHVLCGHHSPVTALCFSPDLNLIVSGGQDGTLCLHDSKRGEHIRTIIARGAPINAVFITPHGYILSHSWSELKLQSYWLAGQLLNDIRMFSRYIFRW